MIDFILIAVFTRLVTVSVAQIKPCCVPAVFQCRMDLTGGLVNLQKNHVEFYDRRIHLYFDYNRQMTRTDTNITLTSDTILTHTEIVDYRNRKTYKVDAGRCSVEDLTVKIQDQCIPDDATLISQGYVGDPDNGFELQVWKYIIPVTNVTVVRAVTALDCWPVNQLEYGIFGGGYSAMSYTTSDVDVNPFPTTVMKQPEYCH